jgi:hypothetical protein
MGYEDDGSAFIGNFRHLPEAAGLKLSVSNGEHFIHE